MKKILFLITLSVLLFGCIGQETQVNDVNNNQTNNSSVNEASAKMFDDVGISFEYLESLNLSLEDKSMYLDGNGVASFIISDENSSIFVSFLGSVESMDSKEEFVESKADQFPENSPVIFNDAKRSGEIKISPKEGYSYAQANFVLENDPQYSGTFYEIYSDGGIFYEVIVLSNNEDELSKMNVLFQDTLDLEVQELVVEQPEEEMEEEEPEEETEQEEELQEAEINVVGSTKGKTNAPVTMIQVMDYNTKCWSCVDMNKNTLSKLDEEYVSKGLVKVELVTFPSNYYHESRPAANAIKCAAQQDLSWDMNDKLLHDRDWRVVPIELFVEVFEVYVEDLGGNSNQFVECFESQEYDSQVNSDIGFAKQNGIFSTPGSIIYLDKDKTNFSDLQLVDFTYKSQISYEEKLGQYVVYLDGYVEYEAVEELLNSYNFE